MKLSYANITSTIALFAALTTGTSYAASQLAANSVSSKQIRNGQVTSADLAPSVRNQLSGRAPVTSGGASATPSTAKPGTYTNTNIAPMGLWNSCSSQCGEGTNGGMIAGPHIEATDIKPLLGNAKYANFRWTGSVTNNGPKTAYFTLAVYRGSTATLSAASGAQISCSTAYAGIEPGQTLQSSDIRSLTCDTNPQGMNRVPADKTRYMRSLVEMLDANGEIPTGITSSLTLEVAPLS